MEEFETIVTGKGSRKSKKKMVVLGSELTKSINNAGELLKAWQFPELVELFKENYVDMSHMQNSHLRHFGKLFRPLTFSAQVCFEAKVKIWRALQGLNIDPFQPPRKCSALFGSDEIETITHELASQKTDILIQELQGQQKKLKRSTKRGHIVIATNRDKDSLAKTKAAYKARKLNENKTEQPVTDCPTSDNTKNETLIKHEVASQNKIENSKDQTLKFNWNAGRNEHEKKSKQTVTANPSQKKQSPIKQEAYTEKISKQAVAADQQSNLNNSEKQSPIIHVEKTSVHNSEKSAEKVVTENRNQNLKKTKEALIKQNGAIQATTNNNTPIELNTNYQSVNQSFNNIKTSAKIKNTAKSNKNKNLQEIKNKMEKSENLKKLFSYSTYTENNHLPSSPEKPSKGASTFGLTLTEYFRAQPNAPAICGNWKRIQAVDTYRPNEPYTHLSDPTTITHNEKDNASSQEIGAKQILLSTSYGREILQYYCHHQCLNVKNREKLWMIINEYFSKHKIPFSAAIIINLINEIYQFFRNQNWQPKNCGQIFEDQRLNMNIKTLPNSLKYEILQAFDELGVPKPSLVLDAATQERLLGIPNAFDIQHNFVCNMCKKCTG